MTRRAIAPLLDLLAIALLTLAVSTTIYPYYWSEPRPAPAVPKQFYEREALPRRIAHRYAIQISESATLLVRESRGFGGMSKSGFAAQTLLGDLAGLAGACGVLLAFVFLHPRGAPQRRPLAFAFLWGGTIFTGTLLWLSVPWPRYLLVVVPSLAVIATLGWSELLRQLGTRK